MGPTTIFAACRRAYCGLLPRYRRPFCRLCLRKRWDCNHFSKRLFCKARMETVTQPPSSVEKVVVPQAQDSSYEQCAARPERTFRSLGLESAEDRFLLTAVRLSCRAPLPTKRQKAPRNCVAGLKRRRIPPSQVILGQDYYNPAPKKARTTKGIATTTTSGEGGAKEAQ
jgi:hypothetical protein